MQSGGATQMKPVVSQSSYISHSDLRVHFGLGDADKIEKISSALAKRKSRRNSRPPRADQSYLLVEG